MQDCRTAGHSAGLQDIVQDCKIKSKISVPIDEEKNKNMYLFF